MTSNLVWEHLSSSSTSGPNLVILAFIVSKRTRRHDDDGDDDGVRGLCHKRLRQLRWARALKIKYLHLIVKTVKKWSNSCCNVVIPSINFHVVVASLQFNFEIKNRSKRHFVENFICYRLIPYTSFYFNHNIYSGVFKARAQRSWRRRLWDSTRTPSPSPS